MLKANACIYDLVLGISTGASVCVTKAEVCRRSVKEKMTFKPDFLGVGAAKAATTTLRDILMQHPQIYLPDSREIHFFDMDENYGRGKDRYQSTAFSGIRDEKICGEFSPSDMYFDHVPGWILESYGRDVKYIFIFRRPVDRAFSHYQMHHLRGAEELDFCRSSRPSPGGYKPAIRMTSAAIAISTEVITQNN